jgi:Mg2+ transporter MgtE
LLEWQNFNPLQDRNASLQLVISREGLDKIHPADLADILEDLTQKDQTQLLRHLNPEIAADTLAEVESETRSILLESMESGEASTLVQAMAPDEAADVLGELSLEKRSEILSRMDPDDAREVEELMKYSQGSAGSLMTTEVLALSHKITAQQAIDTIREMAPSAEHIYYIYIVDDNNKLLGVLSLRELIIAASDTILEKIMNSNVITLQPDDEYEEVLEVTTKYNLLAVPLVDSSQILVGIVTIDDVLDTLMDDKRIDKYSYLQTLRSFRG